jgi:hypothetical protein
MSLLAEEIAKRSYRNGISGRARLEPQPQNEK